MNNTVLLSLKALRYFVAFGLIVVFGTASTWGQSPKPPCGPTPEVEKALLQVTALEDEEPMSGFDPVREKKLKLLGELLKIGRAHV